MFPPELFEISNLKFQINAVSRKSASFTVTFRWNEGKGFRSFFDFKSAPKVAPNEIHRWRKKIAIFVHLWDSIDFKSPILNLANSKQDERR
jgi:hypothetical protein